jgi:hypothetical protein
MALNPMAPGILRKNCPARPRIVTGSFGLPHGNDTAKQEQGNYAYIRSIEEPIDLKFDWQALEYLEGLSVREHKFDCLHALTITSAPTK